MRNMQSSGGTLLRKLLLYALCLFIIVFPLFLSLFGWGDESIYSHPMTSYLKHCFEGNKFWMSPTNDFTSHSLVLLEDGGRVFVQGIICVLAEVVLLSLVMRTKQKHLYPFAAGYSVYSLLVFLSIVGDYFLNWGVPSWYNRFMLWGHYVRALHGILPVIIYAILITTFLYYVIKDLLILRNYKTSNE